MESPVQPSLTPPSTAESQKPWLKWLVIILVVALLSSVATYAVLTSQQTQEKPTPTPLPAEVSTKEGDETANWKTYTYPLYSLRLPQEWESGGQQNPIQFLNYTPSDIGGEFDPKLDKGRLKIEIYTSTIPQELKNFVAQEKINSLELRGEQVRSLWRETTMAVDEQPAIKVENGTPGFVIYTQNPSKTAILSIAFVLDFDNYQELADQILSTFRFTQ